MAHVADRPLKELAREAYEEQSEKDNAARQRAEDEQLRLGRARATQELQKLTAVLVPESEWAIRTMRPRVELVVEVDGVRLLWTNRTMRHQRPSGMYRLHVEVDCANAGADKPQAMRCLAVAVFPRQVTKLGDIGAALVWAEGGDALCETCVAPRVVEPEESPVIEVQRGTFAHAVLDLFEKVYMGNLYAEEYHRQEFMEEQERRREEGAF